MDHDPETAWHLALRPRLASGPPLMGRPLGANWVAALVSFDGVGPRPVSAAAASRSAGGIDGAVARALARTLSARIHIATWSIAGGPAAGALAIVVSIAPAASGLVAAMATAAPSLLGPAGVPSTWPTMPLAGLVLDDATLMLVVHVGVEAPPHSAGHRAGEDAIVGWLGSIAARVPSSRASWCGPSPVIRFRSGARLAIFEAEVPNR